MPKDPQDKIRCDYEIINARGKATIIGLTKHLKSMQNDCHVIHDRDKGKQHAEKFNALILTQMGDGSKVTMLEECIEDVLGYSAPSKEKPFRAYQETQKWNCWDDIPCKLKEVLDVVFDLNIVKTHEVEST